METMTKLGIGALLFLAGTYFYVMALCYLCDLYEQRRLAKQRAEEKKRKERLQRAIDEAEARRQSEMERRKRLAQARIQGRKGLLATTQSLQRAAPSRSRGTAR